MQRRKGKFYLKCAILQNVNYYDRILKSQIRKLSHLQKARESNTFVKFANLAICYLGKLFPEFPPLTLCQKKYFKST